MKTLSIVVPVYYNELNLPTTIPELLALEARLPGYRIELVFADDGSGDRSLAVLREYQAQHPERITIVKLTRNFGSMAAIQAAMSVARGDCVGMIAADLQDPPELFIDMVRHWEQGHKAVFAVRADREESFGQKLFANSYYALIRRFAIRDYPSGGFDFFLVDRQVVDEVCRVSEKNTNLMTLIFWLGYSHVAIPYVRRARRVGKSRWTLAKKIKLFIDSFVAFSYVPVRAVTLTGFLFALAAFLYALVVVYERLTQGTEVRGWSSMAVLIAFSAGVQMMMLGVLGEYLWRALDEVRRRPPYVVDEVYLARDASLDGGAVRGPDGGVQPSLPART